LILILAHGAEPSVARVTAELDARGAVYRRLDTETFPLYAAGSMSFDGGAGRGVIETPDGPIDSRAVSAVWMRRIARPIVPKHFRPKDKAFVANEAIAFLRGFMECVDGVWTNAPDAERNCTKSRQLVVAQQCGLDVPDTLVSNDPDAVRAFRSARPDARVLFKPVAASAPWGADLSDEIARRFGADVEQAQERTAPGEREAVFSQILDAEKEARLDQLLRYAPATFQRYVEKTADIRITYVDGRLFGCRIHSQERAETRIDFRRMALLAAADEVRHTRFDVPEALQARIRRLMSRLGLRFGCLDFVETPAGGLVFLEVNPSGQFLWIEELTGEPISRAIAESLEIAARP